MNPTEKEFQSFLDNFIPLLTHKEVVLQLACWSLYTENSEQAEKDYADKLFEYKLTFTDRLISDELSKFQNSKAIRNPLLKRQLNNLIRQFRGGLLPVELIKEMTEKEAEIEGIFAKFRPELDGKVVSDNDILHILEHETDVSLRTRAWEVSKLIGPLIAPLGLEMVALRNKAARLLGFPNHFRMAYELSELDVKSVFESFDHQLVRSEEHWRSTRENINKELAKKFSVSESELGPWAWSDRFGHEDPLADHAARDKILSGHDVVAEVTRFYDSMGFDIRPMLARSDLYERTNKSQHAFCFPMDRGQDIRILANVKPTWYWFDTMLHESGHSVHDKHINPDLPWLLRTCSHTITTEAAAGITEYYGNHGPTLKALFGLSDDWDPVLNDITEGYKRTQLLFSRWGNVVARFEQALYEDPEQNLQDLYWSLVERYQNIKRPEGRENAADWACKVHVTTAPCYYQNYLIAYKTAAHFRAKIRKETKNQTILGQKAAGDFLKNNFFAMGDRYPWYELIEKATGQPLSVDAWIEEIS